jgi:hypothetical protein
LIKDLLVDPEFLLVFEVQGRKQSKRIYFRPEDFDIYSKSGIGYKLWRNRGEDDGINLDTKTTIGEEETLAWSVLDIFN